MRRGALCALLIALTPAGAAAQQSGTTAPSYSDAELSYWQASYPKGVLENFREVILQKLPQEIADKLQDVRFEFPLRVEGQEPYAFFSRGRTVTMSIASIKFQDDLAVASAWLNRNGYDPATVAEYASMLKYHRLGSAPPTPLSALCIPDSALDNADVNSLAQKGLDSTIVFILLHELGHIYYGHPSYSGISREEARRNEAQADAFALDGMARIGDPPLGIVMFFTAAAHMAAGRGDFDTNRAYETYLAGVTHPVDAARLLALSKNLVQTAQTYAPRLPGSGALGFLDVATKIIIIANTLGDPEEQKLIAQIGRMATLQSLGPRRPGAKMGAPCSAIGSTPKGPFDGLYAGTMTINNVDFDFGAWFDRSGDQVTGEYSYGAGIGRFEGAVDNDVLTYRWFFGQDTGRGVASLQPDGTLDATWGTEDSVDNAGSWHASRQ